MDLATVATHELLVQLDGPAKKAMVRHILMHKELYTQEELCDCIAVLPYSDTFWYTIDGDIAKFLQHDVLWTDVESQCFVHLRSVLLKDVEGFKDTVYRYVLCVHPETQHIPDLTYKNMYDIFLKDPKEVGQYITSILPRSKGYIDMKRKEYLSMIASPIAGIAAEGRKLGEKLLQEHYHPFVGNYIWWPLSKALLIALLSQNLQYRERILGLKDSGYTPMDYIDLCRSPLMWEPDEVGTYTEPSSSTSGNAHARDVSV
jgi:hypothetical protein